MMTTRQIWLALVAFAGLGLGLAIRLPSSVDSVMLIGTMILVAGIGVQAGYHAETRVAAASSAFWVAGLGMSLNLGVPLIVRPLTSTECYYCTPITGALLLLIGVAAFLASIAAGIAILSREVGARRLTSA
jgi:hypothetical protein